MALTVIEEDRLIALEQKVEELQVLVKNATSTSTLNRLRTLCDKSNRETREQLDITEEKLEELILLAQKLQ